MDTIIIAVDLGHFKAYKVGRTKLGSSKMQLIESYDSIEAHGTILDRVSEGRFRLKGGKAGTAKGYGEPHNVALEDEKRLIKLIAKDINAVLAREDHEAWYLAAPAEINTRIIDNLDPGLKAKLEKNALCDLTKAKKAQIIDHFARCTAEA